jgi:hypothetical protein
VQKDLKIFRHFGKFGKGIGALKAPNPGRVFLFVEYADNHRMNSSGVPYSLLLNIFQERDF